VEESRLVKLREWRSKLNATDANNKQVFESMLTIIKKKCVLTPEGLSETFNNAPSKQQCLDELSSIWAKDGERLSTVLPHELLGDPDLLLELSSDLLTVQVALITLVAYDVFDEGLCVIGLDLATMVRLKSGFAPYVERPDLSDLANSVGSICGLLDNATQLPAPAIATKTIDTQMFAASFSSSTSTQPSSIFDPNSAFSIGSNSTMVTSFSSVDYQDVPENMELCEDDSVSAFGFPNDTTPQDPNQASQSPIAKKSKEPCRYFPAGVCKYSKEECPYTHRHDATSSTGGPQLPRSSQRQVAPSSFAQPHAPHGSFGNESQHPRHPGTRPSLGTDMEDSNLDILRKPASQTQCCYGDRCSNPNCKFPHQSPSASSNSGPPRRPDRGISIHGQSNNVNNSLFVAPTVQAAKLLGNNSQHPFSGAQARTPSLVLYDNSLPAPSSFDHDRELASIARNASVRGRAPPPQGLLLRDRITYENVVNDRTTQRPSSLAGTDRQSQASRNNSSRGSGSPHPTPQDRPSFGSRMTGSSNGGRNNQPAQDAGSVQRKYGGIFQDIRSHQSRQQSPAASAKPPLKSILKKTSQYEGFGFEGAHQSDQGMPGGANATEKALDDFLTSGGRGRGVACGGHRSGPYAGI
jgi:hypothetical protein